MLSLVKSNFLMLIDWTYDENLLILLMFLFIYDFIRRTPDVARSQDVGFFTIQFWLLASTFIPRNHHLATAIFSTPSIKSAMRCRLVLMVSVALAVTANLPQILLDVSSSRKSFKIDPQSARRLLSFFNIHMRF